jgi:hypothetical protein
LRLAELRWSWSRHGAMTARSPLSATGTFTGARAVATFFKVVAAITLIGGVIAVWRVTVALRAQPLGVTTSHLWRVDGLILGATVLAACGLAFFGYVLDLLVAIQASTATAKCVCQQVPMTQSGTTPVQGRT